MTLQKANSSQIPAIWEILQQAIEQRRLDGSQQWQDGYPNPDTIQNDITNGNGYVLLEDKEIIAYAAIIFDIEPAYNDIVGEWLTSDVYVVIHRVATSNAMKGKGIATRLFRLIEDLSVEKGVFSIKVDTNFDNVPMLKIMDKLEYTYCGEVFFRGSARRAYEKVLRKSL